MAKTKTHYRCQSCGEISPKWMGQCAGCQEWNTLVSESTVQSDSLSQYAGSVSELTRLDQIKAEKASRLDTGLTELNRVLGGGLVTGSVVLLGGDPGIGKSTLLLQTLSTMSQGMPVMYVTGEESLTQVKLRAERLGLGDSPLQLLAETQVERIMACADVAKPKVLVVDSVQTIYTDTISSAPGGVGQLRESAARLVRYAKLRGLAIFLVGHVTKEGTLAGPRVLEHMVDTVLYFEGQQDNRFRVVRAVKNRFGAVNELGVFAMTDKGLKEVMNPSKIFLSHAQSPVSGSVVMVTWEGTRPLLVEIQALVNESHLANPRRVTVGLESNRLGMLLAVLHRHCGIVTYDQDVFSNVVGGMRVTETGSDLALVVSVISSLRNRPVPNDWVIFGEIGLTGEVRPVQNGQARLNEAKKHGFKHAVIPKDNAPKQKIAGLDVHPVSKLHEVLGLVALA